jgi:hypothetical protein
MRYPGSIRARVLFIGNGSAITVAISRPVAVNNYSCARDRARLIESHAVAAG